MSLGDVGGRRLATWVLAERCRLATLWASPGDPGSAGAMSLGDVVRVARRSGIQGGDVAERRCVRRLALRAPGARRRLATLGAPRVEQPHIVEQPLFVEQPKDVEQAQRCGTEERSAILFSA